MITWNAPAGSPASRRIAANSSAAMGVFSSTLSTTLLPAASAGGLRRTQRETALAGTDPGELLHARADHADHPVQDRRPSR
ncbi:hypothetical protein [Embleya sp. NPDC059259]|uniref:hypothetical protein n=1 Tax=unclassified Embleya TaxID=2699296 RepID=UPI00368C3712